ncbi:hypothetical protein GR28A_00099 [Vibrio phage vB_VcorM_GR28A]|nr:hypothetical protein GR28A_00099 [Vibrio phage vB_VcorM_GR28A]
MLYQQILTNLLDLDLIDNSDIELDPRYRGYQVVGSDDLMVITSNGCIEFAVNDGKGIRRLGDMGHIIDLFSDKIQAVFACGKAACGVNERLYIEMGRDLPSLEDGTKLFTDAIGAYNQA